MYSHYINFDMPPHEYLEIVGDQYFTAGYPPLQMFVEYPFSL